MSKRVETLVVALVCGFLGAQARGFLGTADAKDPPGSSKAVTCEELRLTDSSGKLVAQLAHAKDGGTGLWFFDKDGHAKTQIGVYGDGLPLVCLSDDKGQAVGLFRTAGSKQSPVLVLKSGGRDRMIVGLQMEEAEQEPFIDYWDSKGEKHQLIVKK